MWEGENFYQVSDHVPNWKMIITFTEFKFSKMGNVLQLIFCIIFAKEDRLVKQGLIYNITFNGQ